MGLAKRYMKDGNSLILSRKTHPLQGRKVTYRHCPIRLNFHSHGYLAIPSRRYLIHRLCADVFSARHSSMAKHEGINDQTKVQNDNGKKTVDTVGFFVQGLFAWNADVYQLCAKLKIRRISRLWLLERNSCRGPEKARPRVRLQVWLEQMIFFIIFLE